VDILDLSIVGPGFLAGIFVLATHVPMGREVLRRGIIFIDLAVAQMAGLGVIAASVLGWDAHGVVAQVAAFSAALAGGLLLTWTERRWEQIQEALIGTLFILAATGGILLLANHPKGGDELKELLVGQVLWVDHHQLIPAAAVSVLVLTAWYGFREHIGRIGFYLLFAFSVTVSVQMVGVYLVFASLIIPALATRNMSRWKGLIAGYGVGVGGYAIGMILSTLFDLPTGAVIVWALALAAIVVSSITPKSAKASLS